MPKEIGFDDTNNLIEGEAQLVEVLPTREGQKLSGAAIRAVLRLALVKRPAHESV